MTTTQMIINGIYFALTLCMIFLGLIISIHLNFWLGISMIILFTLKFMFHFDNFGRGKYENKRLQRA